MVMNSRDQRQPHDTTTKPPPVFPFPSLRFPRQARDKELARTPLHCASRSGGLETTLVLLNNGADLDAKTGERSLDAEY